MSNMRFNLLRRARVESAVPLQDCSGRNYTKEEREDIIRYVIWGAEIQRDMDQIGEYEQRNKNGYIRGYIAEAKLPLIYLALLVGLLLIIRMCV